MQCELCGKEVTKGYKAVVEGIVLSVCEKCSTFGNVVSQVSERAVDDAKPGRIRIPLPPKPEPNAEVVVDNFADKIKKEREYRNLTQEEAAKMLAEKESVIHKLESGQMVPSLQLAKKLEQFYHITLIEEFKPEKETSKKLDFKDESLTIGDMIRMRKSKKEE